MKRKLLLVLALSAAMLTGCVSDFYPAADERLTNLSLQPHKRDVEVFFAEEWPKEEYLKVAALEARGGENTQYITLIRTLKERAQRYGADAIVVQGKNFYGDVYSGSSRMVSTIGTSSLVGVAIKYKKNMESELMPKQQYVEMYDAASGEFMPLLNLHLNVQGGIADKKEWQENAMAIYNSLILSYDLNQLKRPGEGWTQREQEGYILERQLHKRGTLQKQITFNYSKERQLRRVTIAVPYMQPEEISYTYDDAGRVKARSISRGGSPYMQEEYLYDETGKVSELLIYNTTLPETTPLLRNSYTYYTLEEI